MESSRAEKTALAQEFASAPFKMNSNAMIFGAAFTNEKLGGIAIKVNHKTDLSTVIGDNFSDLIFNGSSSMLFQTLVLEDGTEIPNSENLSEETLAQVAYGYTDAMSALSLREILNGTDIALKNTTDFQLGYGRKVVNTGGFDVYAGVSGKYILGHNLVEISSDGEELNVLAAFSPALNLSFGAATDLNPTALGNQAKDYASVGSGFGLDLGTTVIIGSKIRLSAAVNDIGSITWKSNLYTLNDSDLEELALNSLSSDAVIPQISELIVGDHKIVEWESAEEQKTELPTTLRLGGAFSISKNFNIGADVISPLDESSFSLDGHRIALGMDIRLMKKFILNSGLVFDEFGKTNVPLGIIFESGAYQCGVSSSDLFTYFIEDQPNLSVAFGFLRFRI